MDGCGRTRLVSHVYFISDGRCNSTTEVDHLVLAYEYCPTKYSWMGVVGLGLYLMFMLFQMEDAIPQQRLII